MAVYFKIAESRTEFEDAEKLFLEYAKSLNIDLCFQGFDQELKTLDTQYNQPKGALILAYTEDAAVGCVAIRELDNETAELKRMFVKKDHRKSGIAIRLLEMVFTKAMQLGYQRIRLDTLPDMQAAQALYRNYGFYEIPSYRFNPVEGVLYMEKILR